MLSDVKLKQTLSAVGSSPYFGCAGVMQSSCHWFKMVPSSWMMVKFNFLDMFRSHFILFSNSCQTTSTAYRAESMGIFLNKQIDVKEKQANQTP